MAGGQRVRPRPPLRPLPAVLLLRPLLVGLVLFGRVSASPTPSLDYDAPSPPVILDDNGDTQYSQGGVYDFEWQGSSLKDIHNRFFTSKDETPEDEDTTEEDDNSNWNTDVDDLADSNTSAGESSDDSIAFDSKSASTANPALSSISTDSTVRKASSSTSTDSSTAPSTANSSDAETDSVDSTISQIEALLSLEPELDFKPVSVEISGAVISRHNTIQGLNETQNVSENDETINGTTLGQQNDSVTKEWGGDDLILVLTWWQILLIFLACMMLAGLCCYFSGCCFLIADCCSDPFWCCCPCCRAFARILSPRLKQLEKQAGARVSGGVVGGAPTSSYSLNENNTAPRASLVRSNSVTKSDERRAAGRVNGAESRPTSKEMDLRHANNAALSSLANVDTINEKDVHDLSGIPGTPRKPRRSSRTSRDSLRLTTSTPLHTTQDDSMASTTSVRSLRNYRRLSGGQGGSLKSSTPPTRTNSFQGRANSVRARPDNNNTSTSTSAGGGARRPDQSLGDRHRTDSGRLGVTSSGGGGGGDEAASNWVYEDSSGYFSWISKLGSKKKQYTVYPQANKNKSSQKKNIYRQSKYYHIPESRNSAVIPVKISKRMSTHSAYNLRSGRARSVESLTSDEDDISQPFLQTKSERHLPSRLSTNLADLETRRARRQSGGSTPVPCPRVPDSVGQEQRQGQDEQQRHGPNDQLQPHLDGQHRQGPDDPHGGATDNEVSTCNLQNFEKSLLGSKETTL